MIEPWVFMNYKRAAEYLLTSQRLTAAEALEFGLVNHVVPLDQLEQTVEELAAKIALPPLTTLMTAKMGLRRAWEMMGMRLHLQQSADLMTVASSAGDVQGFLDPVYQRRMRGETEDPEGTPRPTYPTQRADERAERRTDDAEQADEDAHQQGIGDGAAAGRAPLGRPARLRGALGRDHGGRLRGVPAPRVRAGDAGRRGA
jgi:hypothetical protein